MAAVPKLRPSGDEKSFRVLCCREFQNSISESVHRLLANQIEELGLSKMFTFNIENKSIKGPNGSEFYFEGLKRNSHRIKSYEGVDVVWVEEAASVSEDSWKFLIPTIRKKGSEIWVSFNPENEDDITYQMFVANPIYPELKDGKEFCVVKKVNYWDNDWLVDTELQADIEIMKKNDYDEYLHVYEGHTKIVLTGAVYAEELRKAMQEMRIRPVPYDRMTPVDTFWDLGRADMTCVWFAQYVAMEWRLLDYLESSGRGFDWYVEEVQKRGYVYGTHWLPHDAKAKTLGTKRSIEEQARAKLGAVRIVPKLAVFDGINAARTIFDNCFFDEKKCKMGIKRLKEYVYEVNDNGERNKNPKHNDASHGADAFRTFAVGIKQPKKEVKESVMEKVRNFISPPSNVGWMGQ